LADIGGFVQRVKDSGIALAAFVPRQVFETEAWTFLGFAREDLLQPTERGFVNALSNAKRAVENRVDTLLYAYGLRAHAKRERWNYPTKANKLREAGIFVPEALRNMITASRNDLEHDYRIPRSGKEVGNSVDVAELFLRTTNSTLSQGFFRWVVGPRVMTPGTDPTLLRIASLPGDAYGLLIDHPSRSFDIVTECIRESIGFAQADSSRVAELFRVLYASIEPGRTKVLGPMPESSFAQSFL
jgi:hypothetical protein